MVVAMLTTGLLIVDLRPEIWKDLLEGRVLTLVALGFSLTAIVVLLAIAGARRSWTGFQGKTLWDLLQLLIVPIVLAVITLAFAWQQNARQNDIEDRRAQAERKLAEQRTQDEALQAYLDQMSALLLEKDLRNSKEGSEVRILARARTLTVLRRLGPSGKGTVVQFLYESELIKGTHPVISLYKADLRHTHVEFAFLGNANLSGADLRHAHLDFDYLGNAHLRGANLNSAHLNNASLGDANLGGASLALAVLSGANLSNAKGWIEEQLLSAYSLEGATMPDGQVLKSDNNPDGPTLKHWLKGHREDGQNSSSS
jgi:uncharacterized protein YjbI with pentapeptide repeats